MHWLDADPLLEPDPPLPPEPLLEPDALPLLEPDPAILPTPPREKRPPVPVGLELELHPPAADARRTKRALAKRHVAFTIYPPRARSMLTQLERMILEQPSAAWNGKS